MTKEIINCENFNKLEFHNEKIDFNALKKFEISTELIFNNCSIDNIEDSIKTYTKKITFINCKTGKIWFIGTSFNGGLEMKNCLVKNQSSFEAIGRNLSKNQFIIENCVFNEFIYFFDCYFEGPVKIENNEFKQGTNICIFLQVPYGIKEGIIFKIEDNKGNLFLETKN